MFLVCWSETSMAHRLKGLWISFCRTGLAVANKMLEEKNMLDERTDENENQVVFFFFFFKGEKQWKHWKTKSLVLKTQKDDGAAWGAWFTRHTNRRGRRDGSWTASLTTQALEPRSSLMHGCAVCSWHLKRGCGSLGCSPSHSWLPVSNTLHISLDLPASIWTLSILIPSRWEGVGEWREVYEALERSRAAWAPRPKWVRVWA